MKNAGSTVPIDVDALRVGMFIHLDVGWMSHPFPLSSFRIASAQQIGIIRSLGIRQLRWSPEQSALHDADPPSGGLATPAAATSEANPAPAAGVPPAGGDPPGEAAARR
ncbi:MAG TPA: DUF3391 domain-containing protein, partial [Albitalea sp.]